MVNPTAFQTATREGDLEKIKALLRDNPDLVFGKDNYGETPLHLAALNGHRDVAELLLASKAEVNAESNNGRTPLHFAAYSGHKDVVELLLASEAEVNAKSNTSATPLHYAAAGGRRDVTELLLASKAEINAKTNSGRTPLHEASEKGHKDVAELLVAAKADVNAKDNIGQTPLHLAQSKGRKDVAEFRLGLSRLKRLAFRLEVGGAFLCAGIFIATGSAMPIAFILAYADDRYRSARNLGNERIDYWVLGLVVAAVVATIVNVLAYSITKPRIVPFWLSPSWYVFFTGIIPGMLLIEGWRLGHVALTGRHQPQRAGFRSLWNQSPAIVMGAVIMLLMWLWMLVFFARILTGV